MSILAGICVGLVLAEALRGGWQAVFLLVGTLLGRWLLGKIAGLFFDDELDRLKARLRFRDPVKRQIWQHKQAGHVGRFRDCRLPECFM